MRVAVRAVAPSCVWTSFWARCAECGGPGGFVEAAADEGFEVVLRRGRRRRRRRRAARRRCRGSSRCWGRRRRRRRRRRARSCSGRRGCRSCRRRRRSWRCPTRRRARRWCRRAGCGAGESRVAASGESALTVAMRRCQASADCVEQRWRRRRSVRDGAGRGSVAGADACGARRRKMSSAILLFRLLRAAGEEDDVVVGDAGELRGARACADCCGRSERRRT